jgi:ABC-2 type transport system ATP-binding protein
MIEINNLTFSYSKRQTLFKDLSLSIAKGKIIGLLGLNGAGKSTLMKLLAGLHHPPAKNILIEGVEPKRRNPSFLQDTIYLPEELPESNFTGQWYIKNRGVFYPKFDAEQMHTLLSEFQIDETLTMSSFSYGQKKKFFIAFAIATNAKLLLLDEPTNGLDIPSKSQFRKVIAANMNDDRTIIISTHQVKDLENLIDHITVINETRIVFDASVTDIENKFCFSNTHSEEDEIIYQEKVLGAGKMIFKNTNNTASRVDFELLFNGIIANQIHQS